MSKRQLPEYSQLAGRWFNAQTTAFINILRNILYPDRFNADISISQEDYPAIVDLSWRHKTDYYIYAWFQTIETGIPSEIGQKLKNRINRQAARGLLRLNELLQLCRQFNEQGLKYVVIKGPHMAQLLYGKKAVKFSVDLDFLMASEDDVNIFCNNLLKTGYHCVERGLKTRAWKQKMIILARREIHFAKVGAGIAIDLHTRPFANTLFTKGLYSGFFSDIEQVIFEGVTIPVLPDEKYFVYLCYHGACHQFSRLAWLMDIRRFYELRKNSMEAERIIGLTELLKVKKSLALAFYMMNLLFGTEIPGFLTNELQKVKLYKALVYSCFRSINLKLGEDLKLKARVARLIFLLRITTGIFGKVDLIISVLMRYLLKLVRPNGSQ